MKKRLQKAINDYVILCILCLSLCSSCSLADRSAKPYQSVESISSALSDVTNTNDSILAKDRKIARIVATTVISENKKKLSFRSAVVSVLAWHMCWRSASTRVYAGAVGLTLASTVMSVLMLVMGTLIFSGLDPTWKALSHS